MFVKLEYLNECTINNHCRNSVEDINFQGDEISQCKLSAISSSVVYICE